MSWWNSLHISAVRKVRPTLRPATAFTAPLSYYARRNTSLWVSIQGFACAETKRLFQTGNSRRFGNILAVALRKLDMLNAAAILVDLRLPPGNQLEALQGDRAGQYSIRINRQWRACFVWTPAGPDRVEIVDYH